MKFFTLQIESESKRLTTMRRRCFENLENRILNILLPRTIIFFLINCNNRAKKTTQKLSINILEVTIF